MSATVMPLQAHFETPVFTIHADDESEAAPSSSTPAHSPLFSKKLIVPASTATITPLHTSASTSQFSHHSFSSSTNTPIISPSSVHPTTATAAAETDIDEDIDTPDNEFDGGLQRKRSESHIADDQDNSQPQLQQSQEEDSKPKTRRPRKLSSSSNRRTVAILDWDDTLLPSSWLRKQGHLQSFAYALHQYQLQLQQQQQQQTDNSTSTTPSPSLPALPTLPSEIASHLTSLSSAVITLVRNLMDKNSTTDSKKDSGTDDDEEEDDDDDSVSRVVIVTNAEQGWVELTARSFLPELLPYLDIPSTTNNSTSTTIASPPSTPSPSSSSSASSSSSSSRHRKTQQKISIISARSSFEQQFPGAPLTWKMRAFEKVLGEAITAFNVETSQMSEQGVLSTSTKRILNVLSIGDSIIEREAARRVVACTSSTNSIVLCKSVKLAERTSCEKLCRQLQLMTHALNYVRSHGESLDLQMTITDDAEGKLPPTASMQKTDLPSPTASASTTSTDNSTTSTTTTSTTPSKSPRHHKSLKEIEEVEPPKKAKWWRRVLACGAPVYD